MSETRHKPYAPLDTILLDWLIKTSCRIEHCPVKPIDERYQVIDVYDNVCALGGNPRLAITRAMLGEE